MNKQVEKLQKKIEELQNKKEFIIQQLQLECPHEKVKKSGGGMWHEWPDYGYYPTIYQCLDCGLVMHEEDHITNNSIINLKPKYNDGGRYELYKHMCNHVTN